jgi:flagellar biosynthesis/type III secretory pathway M-ring protein FliF/YscJ
MHVAKVRRLLSYIPGDVLVSVSVDLDVPVAAGDAEGSAKPQADSGEVVANAVPVIPDVTKNAAPMRAESVRSASVAVPRTYFTKIYRRANTGTQEPTDALLQPVVDAYSLKIRNLVKNALGLEHDDAVTVEQYDDALPAAMDAVTASAKVSPTGAATAGAASPPVAAITRNLNTYAREIALVTLGAVVVTAVSLIVRRRTPGRQAVMVDAHGRQHVAGEHEIVNGTLDDVMDDDDDRGYGGSGGGDPHQLFRRVRDMAQEHPDDAARVLRSWIYQQD